MDGVSYCDRNKSWPIYYVVSQGISVKTYPGHCILYYYDFIYLLGLISIWLCIPFFCFAYFQVAIANSVVGWVTLFGRSIRVSYIRWQVESFMVFLTNYEWIIYSYNPDNIIHWSSTIERRVGFILIRWGGPIDGHFTVFRISGNRHYWCNEEVHPEWWWVMILFGREVAKLILLWYW